MEPADLHKGRIAVRAHFQELRKKIGGWGLDLTQDFIKHHLLSVINTCERDAWDEAEKAEFKNLDALFSKYDAQIEKESKQFRQKEELLKLKK